jgi:hypothetical protein
MAGLKLILPLLLMSMLTISVANAGLVDLINAFMQTPPPDMKIGPNLPPALQQMLPTSIMEKLNKLSVKDIMEAINKVVQLLKDLLAGKITPEEFMKKLMEVSPEINALLKDIKDQITKALEKLIAPPGGRRKREVPPEVEKLIKKVLDLLNPPPKNPWDELLEMLKKKLKELLDMIDPPKSLMQQIADALAKAFPDTIKPILQMPKVAEFLGIKPPAKK